MALSPGQRDRERRLGGDSGGGVPAARALWRGILTRWPGLFWIRTDDGLLLLLPEETGRGYGVGYGGGPRELARCIGPAVREPRRALPSTAIARSGPGAALRRGRGSAIWAASQAPTAWSRAFAVQTGQEPSEGADAGDATGRADPGAQVLVETGGVAGDGGQGARRPARRRCTARAAGRAGSDGRGGRAPGEGRAACPGCRRAWRAGRQGVERSPNRPERRVVDRSPPGCKTHDNRWFRPLAVSPCPVMPMSPAPGEPRHDRATRC